MENEPAVPFDALVLPDGAAGVKALQKVGQTLEFIKDKYRHCKTILALGESRVLLQAGRDARGDSGRRTRFGYRARQLQVHQP